MFKSKLIILLDLFEKDLAVVKINFMPGAENFALKLMLDRATALSAIPKRKIYE
jgi:hypothetical protein